MLLLIPPLILVLILILILIRILILILLSVQREHWRALESTTAIKRATL